MEKHIFDEQTGISYTLGEDHLYYPDLEAPEPENFPPLGKYGRMREDYLKEHRRVLYTDLLTTLQLRKHLHEVDMQARERFDEIVESMAKADGCDGELKKRDQMTWVGLMNNYRQSADEIVLSELIYN